MGKVQQTFDNNKTNVLNFIANYNSTTVRLTKRLITKETGVELHHLSMMDIDESIKSVNNKYYTPAQKLRRKEKRKQQRNKLYHKKWLENNIDYMCNYAKQRRKKLLEERKANLILELAVEGKTLDDFKELPINNRFLVSRDGDVINDTFKRRLRVHHKKGGYTYQTIGKKNYLTHRLVAFTYIPNPENKPEVNHLNGIRDDNRVENLGWVTHQENIKYSFDYLGRKSNFSQRRVPIAQYSIDGQIVREWNSIKEASEEGGFAYNSICKCLSGKQKTTGGYRWVYKDARTSK